MLNRINWPLKIEYFFCEDKLQNEFVLMDPYFGNLVLLENTHQ